LAFEVTLYYGPWAGPENNLWFSINSLGWAVYCYLWAGQAAKVLARAISTANHMTYWSLG